MGFPCRFAYASAINTATPVSPAKAPAKSRPRWTANPMGRLTMSSHKQHTALRVRSSACHPQSSRLNPQAGFTLLESLIALAILAIALAAVLHATSASTSHVDALRQRLLADWVAQNRLALHAGRGDWLSVG